MRIVFDHNAPAPPRFSLRSTAGERGWDSLILVRSVFRLSRLFRQDRLPGLLHRGFELRITR